MERMRLRRPPNASGLPAQLVSSLHLCLLVGSLVLLGGCNYVRQELGRLPSPDLPAVYQDSLRNTERNPVIVIPGFGGTKLVRSTDEKILWGESFGGDVIDFASPDGVRGLALAPWNLPPNPTHRDIAALLDDVIATAPLGSWRAHSGVGEVEIDVYAELLSLLGQNGYEAEELGASDPKRDTQSCFTFVYDFRRDNAVNAAELGVFIAEARQVVQRRRASQGLPERPVRFDIVAHSMGGLIARYYLRYGTKDVLDDPEGAEITWAGAKDIDRLVLVAPPNFGTMVMLERMILGRRLLPFFPKLEPVHLASIPASYQLLPRLKGSNENAPLVNLAGLPVDLDLYDGELWAARGWGPFAQSQDPYLQWLFPGEPERAGRRERMVEFMDAAFDRARRFAIALDRHADRPPPSQVYLFAGDHRETLTKVIVDVRDGQLELIFESPGDSGPLLTAPGDSRVSRASAMADERSLGAAGPWLTSPVAWTSTIFITDSHLGMIKNPNFQDNLLHVLLEQPPRRPGDPIPVRSSELTAP